MTKHVYLRAYLAGIALPTMFLLIGLSAFIVARLVYQFPAPIERLLVFPMALVPNIWGAWNMLYARLGPGRRLPLGIHGAVLFFLLAPTGLMVARALDVRIATSTPTFILTVFPVALIVYYLAWKHIVAFFNRLLSVA